MEKLSSAEFELKVLCWTEKTWYFLRKLNIDYYEIWSSKIFLEDNIDIVNSEEFKACNDRGFQSHVVKLKRDGASEVEDMVPISKEDTNKMFESVFH